MLDLPDVLTHLDDLAERVREVEGVFKSISEADTFLKRLRDVRAALEKGGSSQPSYGLLTGAACPELEGESLRVSFAKFQKQVEKVAQKAGHHFKLVKPAGRGRGADEIVCHFEGTPLPLMIEGSDSEVALSREHEVIEPKARATRVFVSFAIADEALATELIDQMRKNLPLRCAEPVMLWRFDEKGGILPGEDNEAVIRKRMAESQFGLLLISPTYLSRPFIQNVEMPHFLGPTARAHAIPVSLQDFTPGGDRHPLLNKANVFQHQGKTFAKTVKANRGAFVKALCDRVAELIEKNLLLPVPSPALALASKAASAAEEEPQPCSMAPCHGDTLIPLKARHEAGLAKAASGVEKSEVTESSVPVLETLQQWLADPQDSAYMALLGESGAGKTMTCSKLDQLLHEKKPGSSIYIDLRRLNESGFLKGNRNPTLEEILTQALARSGQASLTPQRALQAVRTQGALLIWDGLDEVLVHLSTQEGEAFFSQLKEALPPRLLRHSKGQPGRLLMACRTQFFRSFEHESSALTQAQRGAVNAASTEGVRARFRVLRLLPFDDAQIHAYLAANVPGLDVDRAFEVIRTVHNLHDLAQRPYCLSIMRSSLGNLDALLAAGTQVHAVHLYQSLVRSWLARDDTKHRFDQEDKPLLMARLAAWMWRQELRSLPVEELGRWLKETLLTDPVLRGQYGAALEQPASRDELMQDFRTATFIARWDGDAFRFAHTSLQEYFLACHLVRSLDSAVGAAAAWDMPMPSVETLDFVGQLLMQDALSIQQRRLGSLGLLLGGERPRAALVAFRYWLRAINGECPEPAPTKVNLAGAEMEGWEICGHCAQRPLSLRGADLRGARLNRGVLRNVDLSQADLTRAEFRQALLEDVRADAACLDDADLNGMQWRGGSLRGASLQTRNLACHWIGAQLQGSKLPENWETLAACTIPNKKTASIPQVDISAAAFLARVGHSNVIHTCAWSPDNSRLLSGSEDNTLKVWEATSGFCLFTLEGHSAAVWTCAWSPDGFRLLSGALDNTLKVWDACSGLCLFTLQGHSKSIHSCAWSPDGSRLLSGSSDHTLKIWDANSGRCLLTLQGHSNSVYACAWSPNGSHLLSGSADNTLKVWDANSGHCLLTLQGHSYSIWACTWSPDGSRLLSGSEDNTLKVWDASSGRCLLTLQGHSNSVYACAWSSDGSRLLSGSNDSTLKVWDANSGQCLLTLQDHSSVYACAWSPDAFRLLSGSTDNTLKVWDAASGQCLLTFQDRSSYVLACAWSPDGLHLLSGSSDNTLRVWEATSGRCLLTLQKHLFSVYACAWNPDSTRLLSGSSDNTLKVWDARSGLCLLTLQGHSKSILTCAWSPNGSRLLSGAEDNTLKVWDAPSGRCLLTLKGHSKPILTSAWSPDGSRLLSGSYDNTLKVWNASSGRCLLTLKIRPDWIRACAWSPDGSRLLSGSSDNTLKIWDATSGQCLLTLQGHTSPVYACAWSSDGSRLLSGSSDNTLKVWDAASGRCLLTLQGHSNSVRDCAWSPDGSRLLSGSADSTLKVWDAETGRCLWTGHALPDLETATMDAEGLLVSCTPGVWRHLGWRWTDPRTGRMRMLPAEHFGPLPVHEMKVVG